MDESKSEGRRMKKVTFTLLEASEVTGLDQLVIGTWVSREWILPATADVLDQEDIARLRLIHELQHDFGSNDEAIPLILHLVDQLCYFQEQLRRLGGK